MPSAEEPQNKAKHFPVDKTCTNFTKLSKSYSAEKEQSNRRECQVNSE